MPRGASLGKKIEMVDYDTATDPQTSRALTQKAIDAGAYAIIGTVYSGSTIVNMLVAKQAGVPQFTGAEAPVITERGNPYIFRTSSSAAKGVPGLTPYFQDTLKAKKVAVAWVNSEFGKGGRDAFLSEMKKAGITVAADVPSEQGQADFAADIAKIKRANVDAAFVYVNEEESARFLKEARKQGLTIPLVGEVTLTGQKVIELAGEAANGAIAHVGLTAEAPVPGIQAFAEKFRKRYNRETDHNGVKGYIAVYAVKYTTELGRQARPPGAGGQAARVDARCRQVSADAADHVVGRQGRDLARELHDPGQGRQAGGDREGRGQLTR